MERLNKVRSERADDAVAAALARVRLAAFSGENVMPSIMDATVGEVCGRLKEVLGVHRELVRF